MAIKVTLGATENTQKKKPFPKLMINNDTGRIVYFLSERKGICIVSGNSNESRTDHFWEEWAMSFFTDYNDPITIQNQ